MQRTSLRSPLACATLLVGALAGSCADLADIDRDVCGNFVIDRERGEECDGIVPPELAQACRAERGPAVDGVDPCAAACAGPTEDAACQLVADGATTFCPPGYGLGYDGVCRRPSGQFDGTALHRNNVWGLDGAIEDFDGDGFADLLISQGPQLSEITYFKEDGTVSGQVSIPAFFATAGYISDDAPLDDAADLLIANGPALTIYRGADGPQLVPKAYAPFVNPLPGARLYSYTVAPSAVVPLQVAPGLDVPVAGAAVGDSLVFQAVDVTTLTAGLGSATFPGLAGATIGDAVFANVAVDTIPGPMDSIAEDEVLVATQNAVYVRSLVRQLSATMQVGPGEKILRLFPLLGHSRGAAVLVEKSPGGPHAIRKIIGAVDPAQIALDDPMNDEPLPDALSAKGTLGEAVHGLGDVNGDGGIDVLAQSGVWFYIPIQPAPPHYFLPFPSGTEPWDTATIADIHGDGDFEVLALPEIGDLAVLLPGASFTLNPGTISIATPPRTVQTGDFDGDGISDILIVTDLGTEGDPAGEDCATYDDLYILFGRSAGLPEDPVLIGSLRGVSNSVPARLPIDTFLDGVSDLGVQTRCTPNGMEGDFIGVFFGATSRIVSSPFSPYANSFGEDPIIEQIATGQLSSPLQNGVPDLHEDVVLVANRLMLEGDTFLGFTREVKVLAGVGDAEMVVLEPAITISQTMNIDAYPTHLPGLAVGQLLTASPAEEIIVLSGAPGPGGPHGLVHELYVIDGSLTSAPQIITTGMVTTTQDTISRVGLFDFDGDGDLDVLAAVQTQIDASSRLFLNDGATLVPFEYVLDGVPPNQSFDFAQVAPPTCTSFEPTCDPTQTTLVATFGHVAACPYGDGATCSFAIRNGLPNLTLVAGDLSGDGLEDLVTMTPNGTEVYRQCSQSEVALGLCIAAIGPPPGPPPQ